MRMRASLTAVAAVCIAGALLSAQTAQRPQATFRAAINYVEVDVVVTDAQGRFVPGLTAADFELVDEGKKQTIELFREVNLPTARADRPLFAAGPIAPDVASNVEIAEGRVYVLVLDDLHTTPSNTNIVKQRAREFVQKYFASNDLAAVVHTGGRAEVSQDFTSNQALLLKAIDGFMGMGLKSALLNKIEDFRDRSQRARAQAGEVGTATDRDARQRLSAARGTFLTMRDVANHLSSLSGRRKAMLLFSEGVNLDADSVASIEMVSMYGDVQEARQAMLHAIASATRSNVHVYAVEARGMTGSGMNVEFGGVPFGEEAEAQGLTTEALANEMRRAQGTLRTVSEQTGGIAIVNTNRFDEGFARVQRENSAYYLLGFYPPAKPDGKFHRLQVKTSKPGLQVRARAGYHATNTAIGDTPTDREGLADLMTAAVPAAGLPMTVSMPVFKQAPEQAKVLVSVDLPADVLRFETRDGMAAEDLILVYQVIGPNSKVAASEAQRIEMRLRPESREIVEQRGFRTVFPINVAPGRYQLRIAARTENGARRGSVFADLLVPDFFSPRLIWSGISLSSVTAGDVPTRPADPETAKVIPVLPASVRTFKAGDSLALYAEAYDNDTRTAHSVDVTAVIRDDSGKVLFSSTESRASTELGGGRGGYGFRADIPLSGLPPGSYVLTLTARSSASGNATASRDIPFAIS